MMILMFYGNNLTVRTFKYYRFIRKKLDSHLDYHVLLLITLSNSARVILPNSGCFSSHFKNSVFIFVRPLAINFSGAVFAGTHHFKTKLVFADYKFRGTYYLLGHVSRYKKNTFHCCNHQGRREVP